MEHQITIREAITEQDTALFWQQLYAYFQRDICPDPEDEDRAYFLGEDYRAALSSLHERKEDRLFYLFFQQDGQDIGFAMPDLSKRRRQMLHSGILHLSCPSRKRTWLAVRKGTAHLGSGARRAVFRAEQCD